MCPTPPPQVSIRGPHGFLLVLEGASGLEVHSRRWGSVAECLPRNQEALGGTQLGTVSEGSGVGGEARPCPLSIYMATWPYTHKHITSYNYADVSSCDHVHKHASTYTCMCTLHVYIQKNTCTSSGHDIILSILFVRTCLRQRLTRV